LSEIIAGDETWSFEYGPESKRQILQLTQSTSPRTKKARMSKSQMMTMLITFFDIKGIVHFEFFPQDQAVNRAYHVGTLKRLYEAVRRKMPQLWPNDWILYHDNVSANTEVSFKRYLDQKSITEMKCPPCSSGLSPKDFWLFPKIKSALKGRRFQDSGDIPKKSEGSENCSTTGVPKTFPAVAALLV
jgi:hypothetical protein